MVMPGTLRNTCTSASLSGLQAGSVRSSTGASTLSWCFLDSSLYWWFRLWRLSRFLVGCASYFCRGWEGSLLSFSPCISILRFLLLSSGSTLAVMSMSCTGVVLMAPRMTRMLWFLCSLFVLVLAAVPHKTDQYFVVDRAGTVYLGQQ